jgi:hypothetical protein
VQAVFGVVSVALYPGGDAGPLVRVVLRACAAGDSVGGLVDALEKAAAAEGLPLRRLDGEHGLGVCATLPLGGGER